MLAAAPAVAVRMTQVHIEIQAGRAHTVPLPDELVKAIAGAGTIDIVRRMAASFGG